MNAAQHTPSPGAEFGQDWLDAELAARSEFGRRAQQRERRFGPGDEAQAQAACAALSRSANALEGADVARLQHALDACPDPSMQFARARAGDVLSDDDFFEVANFLDALAEMQAHSHHVLAAGVTLPEMAVALAQALAPGRGAVKSFYLSDAFDAGLSTARAHAQVARERYETRRAALAADVAAAAGLDVIRDGEFILMRDQLRDGVVPHGVHAIREAPGYVLCELALDDEALAALAERDAALRDVAEREERVRERLSRAVANAAPESEAAIAALGTLDCALARIAFVQRHGGCVPEFVASAEIAFAQARYLPLAASLAQHGRPYVPISLSLAGSATLTGPNMGGKSAALRTCGFVASCAARGIPVPALSARLGLFDEIVWLGGESAEGALLSAFGREVVELREFFARGAARALVLIDEFARTTSPREGRALLAALLARLAERGACALAATHLPGVAAAAGAAHYAIVGLRRLPPSGEAAHDLETALARIGAAMDYRLERVGPDDGAPADALALAELLGLDAGLIARAKAELETS